MVIRSGLLDEVDAAGVRTFSNSIEITFSDSGLVAGEGVYEAEGEREALVNGVLVVTTQPMVGIHLPDWPRLPARGDTVEIMDIGGTPTYEIVEVLPDSASGVDLVLGRQMRGSTLDPGADFDGTLPWPNEVP